jgi:hypothetical protein
MTLRTLLLLAIIWTALVGCAEKLICPAYQSSFIHDKEALRQKFSYFVNDSTPKVFTASASKNKYLIAEPESYKKRYRKMQTIALKAVQPVVPDSLTEDGMPAELDSASMPKDSLGVVAPLDSLTKAKLDSAKAAGKDSVYVITRDKEIRILKYNFPDSLHYDSATQRYVKEIPYYYVDEVGYNAEQENYMWYFRKQLILPDVRIAKLGEANKGKEAAAAKKKGGFFRKLMFWKKDKKKSSADSLKVAPAALDPNDSIFYTDSASLKKPQQPTVKPKKKGVLSMLKKKEKPVVVDPNKSPAKKEEEGF